MRLTIVPNSYLFFKENVVNIKFNVLIIVLLLLILFSSCKKFVEVDPPIDQEVSTQIFKSDLTAISAINGIYSYLAKDDPNGGPLVGLGGVSVSGGLSADEFTLIPDGGSAYNLPELYANNLSSNKTSKTWNLYSAIYRANSAIEGLLSSTTINSDIKNQLLGEAKFVRAFCYFYLVNFFESIPLVLQTDFKTNETIKKSTKNIVEQQILKDLFEAKELLSDNFLGGDLSTISKQRVRPSKWAASALLSRMYLFLERWNDAETEASYVINNNKFILLSDLSNVFVKNSTEAIWQLESVVPGKNTIDGFTYILNPFGPSSSERPLHLSQSLLSSFEPNDRRRREWVDSIIIGQDTFYYPYKYKASAIGNTDIPTEYFTLLRLSEQYLIRAESRARKNNLKGVNSAESDLNIIRLRAGLPETTVFTLNEMIEAIIHERQIEYFSELAHRWTDIIRIGKVDSVMGVISPIKGGSWESYKQLYPIPQQDIDINKNLLPNNTGY